MKLPLPVTGFANRTLDAIRSQSGKTVFAGSDGAMLLRQRAELMQLKPTGQVSANGYCHLFPTQDKQWIALNLSRSSDWELLPALFKNGYATYTHWETVKNQAMQMPANDLVEQGRALGLPITLAAQHNDAGKFPHTTKTHHICCVGNNRVTADKTPLVVDLSSLWAGPLCSQLLQQAGARVIKVESKQRPDGMRLHTEPGAQLFFNELDRNKELFEADFKKQQDIEKLRGLLNEADIVIEGSRPRALQQLGIDAETTVKQREGLVWLSITGYGRTEPQANWIAFGDDAAISGGLFDWVDNKPAFIGDAIADPLTGLEAARLALSYYQGRQGVLLDINLHGVARYCAGLTSS